MGFSPFDLRAFAVTHKRFIGSAVSQLAEAFPMAPILRVVRAGKILELSSDPTVSKGDIVTVRGDVHDLILEDGELIGPESDEPLAQNIPMEVADVHVGSHQTSGKACRSWVKCCRAVSRCRPCSAGVPNCPLVRKAMSGSATYCA